MLGANIKIKKGWIFAYRVFDIAHEIDLKSAQNLLEQNQTIRRFKLQKDPHRTIIMRDAPLTMSSGEETFVVKLDSSNEKNLKAQVDCKLWDYGVISLCFKIEVPENMSWKELVTVGSILDGDSVIDELAQKRREEITKQITPALKNPFNHTTFEDYTTYIIEEADEVSTKEPKEGVETSVEKMKDPNDLLKKVGVSELILAEPNRVLSDSMKKAILGNALQYTKKDLLILDWNAALVVDFTKEKEYQDYADIIEFSITQLLELRIYDQLLDEKLDALYTSMEKKQHKEIGEFYSALAEEAGQLYIEFSDFFEKIDNSLKTLGDVYLSKVLKTLSRKFEFDDLKRTMSRKMDTLLNISKLLQDKIDSQMQEQHTKTSHKLEWIIIILILLETVPLVVSWIPKITEWVQNL